MTNSMRKHPHLLELNAFLFLRRLSEKYKTKLTLAAIPQEEWKQIAAQGFDGVWLMGVWQRSPAARECALTEPSLQRAYQAALPGWKREDVSGSPYAVYAYALDPFLGNEHDLPKLKAALHQAGLRLILDYVPNHLALDHPLTLQHPDYFVEGSWKDFKDQPGLFFETKQKHYLAHGRDPYFPPWQDTVQINYFSPGAREMAARELLKIAAAADGVRCDMAMLGLHRVFEKTWGKFLKVPPPFQEFWVATISKVKAQFPDFIFLAEAYWDLEWELQQLGFHYTYDKKLYDRLLHAAPEEVRGHLRATPDYQEKSVRFIENHDEARAVTAFGREKSFAAAAVAATIPGLRLFHDGQIEGRKIHLPIQLNRAPHEAEDATAKDFYKKLLAYAHPPALHDGRWAMQEITLAGAGSENLLAWSWQHQQEARLVVINYSASPAQGRVRLPPEWLPKSGLVLKDIFSGKIYQRDSKEMSAEGLYVELTPWGVHLFEMKIL